MKMQGRVLSEEEKLRIHKDSVRILEEVGVRVPSHPALALLESGGARIDWDSRVAFISGDMVRAVLETAPKEFVLGARNPAMDLALPSPYTVYNMDGCGVNTIDFNTGARRSAVLQDIADSARVFEEIGICNVYWPPVSPGDIPNESGGIVRAGISFMNTSKHIMDEVKKKEEVPYIIEMCKAILGDAEKIRERMIYSVTYCTVAPLCHDEDMLEATMELSKFMAPILVYPMPACGTTGPASLHSNIALANAEALSSLVIYQLASPGVPILYGSALGVVNVRSGMFLEGAVETALQMTAMGEMGKYYGLPTMNAGCLTDAKAPGMQAVMEKVLTTLPLVLAGSDIIQGIGLIESSMTLSLEQMIIDGEIANLCRRIKDGVKVSDDLDFFDDIKAVGPGGHFLKQKNTRAAFRTDQFYQTELCDRSSYDTWADLGRKDMIDFARAKVKAILEAEIKNPLPGETEKLLREIMEEARRKLDE
ncbi:MAG TPA: trimethylamine methyltransferase family protein [Anaerovoracaceae bacterium]|nr:trimethylamine methyltransferase family protein [Anaerovoracaceae bacterium]